MTLILMSRHQLAGGAGSSGRAAGDAGGAFAHEGHRFTHGHALADRHERLPAVLRSNLMVLATAHAVSEGILRRLSGDLARKAMAPPGSTTGSTKRAAPLALSRTL